MSAATSHTPFFLLTPHLWALVCVHVCVWDGKWGWMSLNITRQKEDTISASIRLWVWVGKVIIVSSVRRDQMRQLISTFNQRNKYYTRGDFLETLKVHPKSLGISWRGWFQHLCFMRGKTCTLCLTKQLSSSQQPKDMGTVTISILQRKKMSTKGVAHIIHPLNDKAGIQTCQSLCSYPKKHWQGWNLSALRLQRCCLLCRIIVKVLNKSCL